MKKQQTKTEASAVVTIKPPKMETIRLKLRGELLCINKFSRKAAEQMAADQAAGGSSKSKKRRDPKDFKALYEAAKHVSNEGWCGIHAAAFRNASVSACRIVGYKMTLAKLALFIVADGYDKDDGSPLVRITKGEPEMNLAMVRNQTGVPDIRPRPLWRNWEATLTVRYDADLFSKDDVVNLIQRVGMQVGVGEGRPDSKNSAGIGYGLFEVV
jgi:hypothetical protein